MKKTICVLALLTALCLLLAGCALHTGSAAVNGKTDQAEGNTMLNERQIRILREQGLPTDYDKLTISQRSAILSIDLMLSYLEEKYDMSFAYEGYWAADTTGSEKLLASSGEWHVTAWRTYEDGAFQYSDNFPALKAAPLYQEALRAFFAERAGDKAVKVFSEIRALDEDSDKDILRRAGAMSYIFIPDSVDRAAFDSLIEDYAAWIPTAAEGQSSYVRFVYLEKDAFDMTLPINYSEMSQCKQVIASRDCDCSASGKISFY